ncbi:PAS domain S-box protein [Methylocystis sp. MJC1]|jgi:PAS domain S-box-containing protein|uniref:PAS domain-containing sensor histidine kinase n=1 Tax=Methylocystis sp. MJC1 TaxID=2654282 RepID=UPI0013EA9499|nr:PAS domain S-box protein [Methylocystis sp. MJC1]KAF2989191.1 Sensor protein FixL [Methylocystis sp. MJC1]MBU6526920.1 PAS domain S-box protein [Methylocystis sp. MJC1]UZX13356.1 PAS domain S-box protein [Methylocystis sp. MJC1]
MLRKFFRSFQMETIPDRPEPSIEQQDAQKAAPAEREAEMSAHAMMTACVEAMPGAIASFRFTPDGIGSFPYGSANFEEIFGFPPEESAADLPTMRSRIHPDDIERIDAAIATSAAQLTKYHEEYRFLHPTKGAIWIEVHSMPTRERDGSIIWHGYVCDVTARKRAEEELRLSEARHRAFFDANLIGVCYASATDATITEANDKYLEMLGYTREDLKAKRINWRELTPPEYAVMNEAAMAEVIATGKNARPTEKEYFRKDGSRLPVLVARAILDRDTMNGVAFILDISELKEKEARLREAHRGQLAMMRSMALGIAHEINQPLAATATYLRVLPRLLEIDPAQRPASVLETVKKAVAQVMRAGEIVSRLRSFIAHGEPDKLRVNMHELILEAMEPVVAVAHEKQIAISLDLGASSSEVLADRVQIMQVLINLIRNAKEAMEHVVERGLVITTRSNEADVRVDIADTGVGLSEKRRNALFVPFATTKPSGMGVGLSISREIIEAHHGRIWAEENPEGHGAMFSFTLPLVGREAEKSNDEIDSREDCRRVDARA